MPFFCEKSTFLVPCVEKDKKKSQDMPYFGNDFYCFYIGCTKVDFFMRQLYDLLGCGDIPRHFVLDFFDIFKYA
jgi:hypothetical protein